MDLIEYEGGEYVVLLTRDEDDDCLVVILKVEPDEEDEEMENYVAVEDEAVINAVFEIFKEKFKDEFNFTDTDDSMEDAPKGERF